MFDIVLAGKALRICDGGIMQRRFQAGHLFARGKRRKVWVARYLEPILKDGKILKLKRARVIGPCGEISKRAARTILQGWLRPFNEGTHLPIESAGFQDFYDKWERDLLPTYRESTRGFYQSTARRWIQPYFKNDRLAEIQPAHVQQFINLFAARYSKSVLKHVRATLNCLFETAVSWRYAKENPARGLKLPGGKAVIRATVLQPAQMGAVVEYLAEPYRTMVVITATTGLRESEVFALRGEDFDFERYTVTIRRRLYRGKIGEPKTSKSAREIPLHPAVVDAARALARPASYLFLEPDGSGEAALEHKARLAFAEASRALGIPAFTLAVSGDRRNQTCTRRAHRCEPSKKCWGTATRT